VQNIFWLVNTCAALPLHKPNCNEQSQIYYCCVQIPSKLTQTTLLILTLWCYAYTSMCKWTWFCLCMFSNIWFEAFMVNKCNEIFLGEPTFRSLSLPSPSIRDDGGTDSLWNAGNLIQYSHIWLSKKTSMHYLMLLQLGFTTLTFARFHTSVTHYYNYSVILIWDCKFFRFSTYKIN
jgi:hypothetical protein